MHHSEQPLLELAKARAAIDAMRSARTLESFEENWKEFITRLERVWYKAFNHFKKSPKWNGWKGKVESLRKTDPLLAYLVKARGVEQHTVEEIVRSEPGTVGILPPDGIILASDFLQVSDRGVFINSPRDFKVIFSPAKMTLLPVTNFGRTYPVPTEHLGNPIDSNNVIEIAEAGMRFYEQFLSRAKEFFVK